MPGKLQGPHNEFGQCLAAFCVLYGGISISELARRAGIAENTLLDNMAEEKPGPSTATLDKLWIALDELAQEAPLRESVRLSKPILYHSAGRVTPEERQDARDQVKVLRHFADVQGENQRLQKENERLNSRRRPRTS